LINIAAHEIRTPAHSILGYAEMLDMEHIGSKEYVIPILRNAERLKIDRRYITIGKDRKSDIKTKQGRIQLR
jgi:signal transduction histidine kinase